MRRKGALPELLAPAGDFDCLIAAVKAGADAVYLGAKGFNARAYAGNFDDAELRSAVEYCHLFGVRVFVTLNTLPTTRELPEALSLAARLYEMGVDALIVADVGLTSLLHRILPEMELHASTQMSVHNSLGADVAYDIGCRRVVLARELSGKNIAEVVGRCKPECEVFLHGALCVCHSGQCLFSSMVGGRSGNRGECAQPCRLPDARGKYPLSLKDLSLAQHIRELVASGVSSLKIEGRMKSADYVYTVTSIYRELLDSCRDANADEMRRLERVFSRDGFTDGYFTRKIKTGMTGVRRDEDKRASRDSAVGKITPDRVPVSAKIQIRRDRAAELTLTVKEGAAAGRSVTVLGEIPAPARSVPLTEEGLAERVARLGGTPFSLDRADTEVVLDEGLNMSPAAINALRRDAVERLLYQGRVLPRNLEIPKISDTYSQISGKRTALFLKVSVYNALRDKGALDSFSACFLPLWRLDEAEKIPEGVYIPPVIMEDEIEEIRGMLSCAAQRGVKYALVGNLGGIALVREAGLLPVGDFRLNVTNAASREALCSLLSSDIMLSPELTLQGARECGGRVTVYGRIPLMLTERCFMRDVYGCEKCSECALTDRRGVKFPMAREWRHRCLILNSAPTYMGDKRGEMAGGVSAEHFIFTTEDEDAVMSIVRAFENGSPFPLEGSFRRLGKREVK